MDGAALWIWSSDSGESLRSTGEREAKRDASCMVFLLTKGFVVQTAHRIPRFGAQPFGCSVRSARGTRLALLPPSFLSSSPATVRSARTGAVKEASAGLVRPAAQRGHGPARLDGTRARATVAVKVMKSGETAGQGNGHPTRRPHGKRSAQARI